MTPKQSLASEPADDRIWVVGARENNLKNVTVAIPKGRIVVFTGVSGSGKSSLVFDTIAAESQRQLNETFPAFVRNRLPHYGQPDADRLQNLSAAIVVDQKRLGGNARSTVGTATEIYNLLRLLYSRVGTPFVGYSPAFSFNDPRGMCSHCAGLGTVVDIDVDRLIDRTRSLDTGAIRFSTFTPGTYRWKRYVTSGLFDNARTLRDYTDEEWHALLHADGIKPEHPRPGWPGTAVYQGVLPRFRRSYLSAKADKIPAGLGAEIEQVVQRQQCPACHGARLNSAALSCTINGRNIADCANLEVGDLVEVIRDMDTPVAAPMVTAIVDRLQALVSVGLGYLSLHRETPTLSGGESQRVKIVRHLGSSLTDLTYILDEPSVGLHPHDVAQLNDLIRRLRDKGNTVLVVEHDPDVIAVADHVIDLGPAAGANGGEIVYQGAPAGLARADTCTGRHLDRRPTLKATPRTGTGKLTIEHATRHNLRDVTVAIPRGVLTVVTGVAGSGKSTLVNEILPRSHPDTVVIDQSGIHASRRSNPATYTGIFDAIRALFARTNHVRAALFSANSDGACPACKGLGVIHTDLAFLDSVTTVCEECRGCRYNPEALGYTVRGHTISDVLALTVAAARALFDGPDIRPALVRLEDVGLGYLTLGQPLNTLSGGERQRIKLAAALERRGQVYVLDEPTTGLHMSDVARLLEVLDRLVDDDGTVIVIEHNLDIVSQADWIIDLGPGAGRDGGRIVFEGFPADIVMHPTSVTGRHLGKLINRAVR
jgi:excinuclease UvrABC ATPase subunit